MNASASSIGDVLINGALWPSLWRSLANREQPMLCAVERRTFAVDRWAVRYAAPTGGAVSQSYCADIPTDCAGACSVVLRPAGTVTETVYFGQRIEAVEAVRARAQLTFSTWLFIEGRDDAEVALHLATPRQADVFGGPHGERLDEQCVERAIVPRGRWTQMRVPIDGRRFSGTGLSLELAFAAPLFDGAVRIAQLQLADLAPRPAAIEALLAQRFFQRHDSTRINSLGRALVVNAHELHFQFTFPEMRAFPACTLPHSEEGLRVFNLEGLPQSGFRYDVTYRSRSSVIIRAIRENHGLSDGFLSFVGTSAAILLDAEL